LKLKLGARQAVAAALDDLSVPMVPLEDVLPEDASCTEPTCFATIAKRVEATHILLVQGVANPAGYRLNLEVRDGETGRTLATDGKDCELCTEDQLAPTVQDKVTSLWRRVMLEESKAKAKAESAGMAPVTVTEKAPPPAWYEQRTPLMGMGFAAVGLVGVGFGVYYIAQDGKTSESTPNQHHAVVVRDTGKWGWTLTGVGLAALVAGSAMIIWGQDDGSNVSVAVGPQSLGLQGRF
jgi:hypothetical protein